MSRVRLKLRVTKNVTGSTGYTVMTLDNNYICHVHHIPGFNNPKRPKHPEWSGVMKLGELS